MTIIIKNKNTGLSTECSNADVIKVCRADTETYEVIEAKATVKKTTAKKAPTGK